jgi:hypothetical protein
VEHRDAQRVDQASGHAQGVSSERSETSTCARCAEPTHPQVYVSDGQRGARVDEALAELIPALWRCGIHTSASCQDVALREPWPTAPDDKRLQIVFSDPDDLRLLMAFVATSRTLVEGAYRSSGAEWMYGLYPFTTNGVEITLRPSVYIPHSHLPVLIDALAGEPDVIHWPDRHLRFHWADRPGTA